MAIITQAATVGTSASKIAGVSVTSGAIRSGSCVVQNLGASPVFLGGATVTIANGLQLDPGSTMAVDIGDGDDLYAVVASGTVACRVLQVGGN